MIGATADAIDKAEDRSRFDKAMKSIGLECPRADTRKAWKKRKVGYGRLPCIIRPSFTMGGSGGIAYNRKSLKKSVERGLDLSPTNELLDRRIADRLERVRNGSGA